MIYSDTYFYVRVFLNIVILLFSILLSVSVAAENNNLSPDVSLQKIQEENIDIDELDEDEVSEDTPLTEDPEPEIPFFSFLDKPQEVISSGVETMARNMDEFFSDDKVFYESSGTYLRLRADAIWNEGGDIGYKGDIRLKLRLPHTKRKLKFVFQSDLNERPDEVTAQTDNTPIEAVEEKDYFAGLQTTVGDKDGWQFKPSLGIRLSSTIDPFVRFRFRRNYEFTKWSIRWHETPYWFDSFGWGFDSYLEFNRKITDKDLFRAATFARWTNEINQFEMSQTFSMYHTLSKRRAISYYAGVYGISEPTVFATHYALGLTYRQNIHKGYLFLELIPQIRYEKTNDFHADHSLTLRLEMIFKK